MSHVTRRPEKSSRTQVSKTTQICSLSPSPLWGEGWGEGWFYQTGCNFCSKTETPSRSRNTTLISPVCPSIFTSPKN
ncbi:hypothetical protein FQ185_22800 [Pseudomonas sp. ANT_H12B]|nr:hypothetical protein FQ185_22800 [Pseudomonas sp. ANT_H12B]